jgi:hypothetical protein
MNSWVMSSLARRRREGDDVCCGKIDLGLPRLLRPAAFRSFCAMRELSVRRLRVAMRN